MLPTLYSIDSKQNIRQWRVWTEGADIIVEHGLMGGKLQQKRTTAKAKNTGRANATTAEEQAKLEAQSKWNAQVKLEDYADVGFGFCATPILFQRFVNDLPPTIVYFYRWENDRLIESLQHVFPCSGTFMLRGMMMRVVGVFFMLALCHTTDFPSFAGITRHLCHCPAVLASD